jgi:exportin-1
LIDNLRNRFLQVPEFRNITLKCLTEIGSIAEKEYSQRNLAMFDMVMSSISVMIPLETDIATVYLNATDEEQEFIQNLSLFITTFLRIHLRVIGFLMVDV